LIRKFQNPLAIHSRFYDERSRYDSVVHLRYYDSNDPDRTRVHRSTSWNTSALLRSIERVGHPKWERMGLMSNSCEKHALYDLLSKRYGASCIPKRYEHPYEQVTFEIGVAARAVRFFGDPLSTVYQSVRRWRGDKCRSSWCE